MVMIEVIIYILFTSFKLAASRPRVKMDVEFSVTDGWQNWLDAVSDQFLVIEKSKPDITPESIMFLFTGWLADHLHRFHAENLLY